MTSQRGGSYELYPGPVQHANPPLDVEFFYSQGGGLKPKAEMPDSTIDE